MPVGVRCEVRTYFETAVKELERERLRLKQLACQLVTQRKPVFKGTIVRVADVRVQSVGHNVRSTGRRVEVFTSWLRAGVPLVAEIFPIAAACTIKEVHLGQVFDIFVAELN